MASKSGKQREYIGVSKSSEIMLLLTGFTYGEKNDDLLFW